MTGSGRQDSYRVTIRYQRGVQQYEILQVTAADLREALAEALARFPDELASEADLIEIRLANPADAG